MDFLVHSQAAPDAGRRGHGAELDEAHWSYMDGFAPAMTARGPTLAADRETWTGSVHVVDLPSVDAVRGFVADEPYNRAGLYAGHRVWRFENLLGRTMWEYERSSADPCFLVIAHAPAEVAPDARCILRGNLLELDGGHRAGAATIVQAPARDAVAADLRTAEVHDWEFGGRR